MDHPSSGVRGRATSGVPRRGEMGLRLRLGHSHLNANAVFGERVCRTMTWCQPRACAQVLTSGRSTRITSPPGNSRDATAASAQGPAAQRSGVAMIREKGDLAKSLAAPRKKFSRSIASLLRRYWRRSWCLRNRLIRAA